MRSVTALVACLFVVPGFTLLSAPPAQAEACAPGETATPAPSGVGTICVPAVDPGDDGDGAGGGNGGAGQVGCPSAPGRQCTSEAGVWFNDPGCYAAPLTPQPGLSDQAWNGHAPNEGKLYGCSVGLGGTGLSFFVANGADPLPDPRDLAQNALDQLRLETPDIKIAPAPPLATYVGLETWLWIPQAQWGDLSLTVTAGSTSVTVVAAPKRVDWDLTTGTTSCFSPGREWIKGMSSNAKTTCSYTFSKSSDDQANKQFPITATLIYSATWTCSGACTLPNGDLGDVPSLQGQVAIEVNERQSVIKNGP